MDGLQNLRFVTFAFAGADILLEADPYGSILFCAGATQRLLGVKAAALEGTAFANLFPLEDRPTVAELVARLIAGERLSGVRLVLDRPGGRRQPVCISGMTARKGGGAMQIALRRREGGGPPRSRREPGDAATLTALLAERAGEAELATEPCVLTVLQLPDGPSGGMVDQALGRLRAWSLWGDSLLALPGQRVALVHSGRIAAERLADRMAHLTGVDCPCLGSIALDCAPSVSELTPALRRELDRLAAGQPLGAVLLSQALRDAARAALAPVTALRSAIGRTDITLLYHPVISLRKWTVHHFEALARLGKGDALQLPERFLRSAANQGLAADFDLAVCRVAVRGLAEGTVLPPEAHLAINISGAALAAPGFAEALLGVLGSSPQVLSRVLIEVAGLAGDGFDEAVAVLRHIRTMGCRVTLDDLLNGGPDLSAIHRVHPDFLKIDAITLREALQARSGVALLRALSQLCDDLGIGSVVKRVEHEPLVRLLCQLSFDLGQGHYFARPAATFAADFAPTRPAAPMPRPAATRAHAAAQALILPPMGSGRHALAKEEGMAHRHRP
jgi:EAL domain-containing protein (putative c-di-GMP-specific phosphodiesterase class I)